MGKNVANNFPLCCIKQFLSSRSFLEELNHFMPSWIGIEKFGLEGRKPTAVLIFATQCVISRFFLYVTPHNKGHFMDVLL